MILTDLCVAAALDSVKAGVTLPWRATDTPDKVTPSHVLVVEDNVDDESSTMTDPAPAPTTESSPLLVPSSADSSTSASSESEATLKHPHRVISLSNFEQALKEITPSSSESLGTLSELRKWNDEFGEGKREKRRNMWGKGKFGFVEKGEGVGEIKIAASAGRGGGEQLSP